MKQTLGANKELIAEVSEGFQLVLAGTLLDEKFKFTRLGVGAHRQRLGDGYMVRVRVPGGRLSLEQWRRTAEVAAARASRIHLTLRQDLQLYGVPLHEVADTVGTLNKRGLSTLAAGGNTVRNITCGILGDQESTWPFDPYPYAASLSARLSRHPLFGKLPRKFKIGFAGPGAELAQAWINDLGFIATRQDGMRGFRLLGGGGLGASPQSALELEAWIPASTCGPYAEAALEYFAEHSPPDKPMSNRFKFVLRSQGLRAVRSDIHERMLDKAPDEAVELVTAPEGKGLWVEAPLGDWSPSQMLGLSLYLAQAKVKELRIGFDQRIFVPGVGEHDVAPLIAELSNLGLRADLHRASSHLVVCAGPETCNRGLVNSKALGRELAELELPLPLHVSGCQNGCSQNLTAPLGLQGMVKSGPQGRMPYYQLRVGQAIEAQGIQFGPVLLSLGARRVKPGLERLLGLWKAMAPHQAFSDWLQLRGGKALAVDLEDLLSPQGEDLRKDLGTEKIFEVVLGASECH